MTCADDIEKPRNIDRPTKRPSDRPKIDQNSTCESDLKRLIPMIRMINRPRKIKYEYFILKIERMAAFSKLEIVEPEQN